MARIPRDILESMQESGISFDENGDIVEEKFIGFNEDDEEDEDETSDTNTDTIDNDEDQDDIDLDDDEDEDEDNDDLDEDEDEEVVEEKPKPKAKKEEEEAPKLTPRKPKQEDPKTISQEEVAAMEQRILDMVKSRTPVQQEDEDDESSEVVAGLRREVEDFRRMKIQHFADTVENRVNSIVQGASFKDIIASSQWDEFLETKAYGQKIGNHYKNAIKSYDVEDAVSFFTEFANRYLKPLAGTETPKQKSSKKNLDDLAVPDKTKTNRTPRIKKYDFEEDDYEVMLDKFSRGSITHNKFAEFDEKFSKALANGRVKPSNSTNRR